jgi:hypothetical protein
VIHVAPPAAVAQACLDRGRPHTPEQMLHGQTDAPRQAARQQVGLVEAALPSALPVQGHGGDGIEAKIAWEGCRHVLSQRRRQSLYTGVLIKMDQLAERAIVLAETVGVVEAPNAQAAERALAGGVERKLILKGRTAANAVVVGLEGLRPAKAIGADRDAGNFLERSRTKPAISRIKEGKKGAKGCSYY